MSAALWTLLLAGMVGAQLPEEIPVTPLPPLEDVEPPPTLPPTPPAVPASVPRRAVPMVDEANAIVSEVRTGCATSLAIGGGMAALAAVSIAARFVVVFAATWGLMTFSTMDVAAGLLPALLVAGAAAVGMIPLVEVGIIPLWAAVDLLLWPWGTGLGTRGSVRPTLLPMVIASLAWLASIGCGAGAMMMAMVACFAPSPLTLMQGAAQVTSDQLTCGVLAAGLVALALVIPVGITTQVGAILARAGLYSVLRVASVDAVEPALDETPAR